MRRNSIYDEIDRINALNLENIMMIDEFERAGLLDQNSQSDFDPFEAKFNNNIEED